MDGEETMIQRRQTYLASLLLFSSALTASSAHAQVQLPSVWASHAVVQRDMPVRVWGHAATGEHISVHFRGAGAATTADDLGRWKIDLPPGKAGGPFTMDIDATNHIELTDLLVGDVWLASGQSNMELTMPNILHADEEIKNATQPNIRLFQVQHASADFPQTDARAKTWTSCTPESVANFSAVAYFFGRNIQADQKVPIGLIESDWGGTPAETWTSQRALSADGSLMPAWQTWAQMSDDEPRELLQEQREARETAVALAAGKPAPHFDWHPEFRSWLPGGTFNAMIAPLVPFPIRGVIWYQGESNASAERSFYYQRLFSTLIADWRTHWNEGYFPFLFVQIANYSTSPDGKWPELRDAQRRTLSVTNTGMAVTIDIGDPDNIHPKNKQEVGRRLSLAARAIAYHEPIEDSGPLYQTVAVEGSSLRVYFQHTSGGLKVKGSQLTGFEIAGDNGKFVPAEAKVEADTVVVSAPQATRPTTVRYGWSSNPTCNLYNGDGLPASPFTSAP